MPGLKKGYTTGACAAAAAKAATRLNITRQQLTEIRSRLPNGTEVVFPLKRCEIMGEVAICSIIKDAGDDPDCTHGAELTASVRLNITGKVQIVGGEGVAVVTKPGLGLVVGSAAITPAPRQNISDMVREELQGSVYSGAQVEISVPGGEKIAEQTINQRLGLLGGISILGVTGIVKPFSTAAYLATIYAAIEVAQVNGLRHLVFTTGGRTENSAMRLLPHLEATAFIQVADYVGAALLKALSQGICEISLVWMIGKLSKLADGQMVTHATHSEYNRELIVNLARKNKISLAGITEISNSATARRALEICLSEKKTGLLHDVTRLAWQAAMQQVEDKLQVNVYLVDFDGELLTTFNNGDVK